MKRPSFDPHWPEEVFRVYEHDVREMWDPRIDPHIWNQYHAQLDLYLAIAGRASRLRVLDVGCAQATLALLLAERGHDVVAMDLREQFLVYARSRYERGDIQFVAGDVFEAEPGGEFDLIFCNQLLEHLVYPERLLSRLRSWLASGGRLVVTTPNGAYIRNRLPSYASIGDPDRHRWRQFSADGDGHFFAYRPGELRELFSKAGFERTTLRHFETPWISGHMKLRYLGRIVHPRLLRALDHATLSIPAMRRFFSHQLLVVATKQ